MDLDASAAFEKALPSIARSSSPPDKICYARDLWPRHHLAVREGRIAEHRPGLIVWPTSTEEVAEVVRFCATEGMPLVPFGAGSGVCGGVLPDPRTVVLDLKRMNRVRSLDAEAPSLSVEAGALGIRLEEDLFARGYTLGHFPSSILCSTVGGWVAARSAGQCSGRYGKIEDMVTSLECVVGRGEVVELKRRVHGPDLTHILIGSEGVLGVVTAASLRLHPAPNARVFSSFSFPTIEAGWSAMREMFQRGLRPAVARLYDPFDSFIARQGRSKRRSRGKNVSAKSRPVPGGGAAILRGVLRAPSLLNHMVELLSSRVFRGSMLVLIWEETDASLEGGRTELAEASAIAARFGARDLGEGPARRWLDHRYSVSYRQAPIFMAGAFSDTMEVAAPWSRLGALYDNVREAIGEHAFVMAHLSHAYPDGCSIYFTFVGSSPTIPEMERRYDAAWKAALDAAIASGGTLSHHHGVGRSKAPKLGAELGLGVDIVHALRGAFDPAGVMNPGNLLPREAPARRSPAPPPASPELDVESLLIRASGAASLADIERALAPRGLSLGLGPEAPPLETTTVDAWIAGGARGAPDPFTDPVDHLVAGFTARLPSGAELEIHAAPRRAVGPDLFPLFLGTNGRTGSITSAQLRVRGQNAPRPLPFNADRDPAQTPAETAWIERALATAAAVH